MQRYINIFSIILISACFFGCKPKKSIEIKIKKEDLPQVKIIRFDRMMANLNEQNFSKEIVAVRQQAPEMFQAFIENITGAGSIHKDLYINRIKPFILDRYSQELYRDVHRIYPDLKEQENELSVAFGHVRYYFPGEKIPHIYSIITNFAFGVANLDSFVAVSLDFFLGSDYKYYSDPNKFPVYIRKYMTPQYMVPEIMKAYFEMKFPEDQYSGKDLLSQMIYQGKMLYFLELMMPDLEDSVKIKYSKKQLTWAKTYEGEIWSQMVRNNILFSSEDQNISGYLEEAPFTNAPNMPQVTPPRIAEWVGWQIVKKYAESAYSKKPSDVFYEKSAQRILTLSKYKPKVR